MQRNYLERNSLIRFHKDSKRSAWKAETHAILEIGRHITKIFDCSRSIRWIWWTACACVHAWRWPCSLRWSRNIHWQQPPRYKPSVDCHPKFGHVLGLDHSSDRDAFMYPYYPDFYHPNLSLEPDYIPGIKSLYGKLSIITDWGLTAMKEREFSKIKKVTCFIGSDYYCDITVSKSLDSGLLNVTTLRQQLKRGEF